MKFQNFKRKKRKLQFIKVKNNQRANGMNFESHHVLGNTKWADIYFIDPKTKLVYNCTIETIDFAVIGAIDDAANDIVFANFGDDYSYPEYKRLFVIEHERIVKRGWSITGEVLKFEHGYRFGIGCTFIVNEDLLTKENIASAVDRFLNGTLIPVTKHFSPDSEILKADSFHWSVNQVDI